MRRPGKWGALVAALALTGAATAVVATVAQGSSQQRGPIIIGAAMDLTANMAPYDTPALYAVRAKVKEVNAAGGVGGRKLQVKLCNHQLKNQKTCALQLIQQGAVIGMVTCDVEFAAPATQEFINKGMLALSPCIGTDQQGPKRFGPRGPACVHARQYRPGRGCRDGRVLVRAWLEAGRDRPRQPARVLPEHRRLVQSAFHGAWWADRPGGSLHVLLQHDSGRYQQGREHECGRDRVPHRVRRARSVRRRTPSAREQHTDHQLMGW